MTDPTLQLRPPCVRPVGTPEISAEADTRLEQALTQAVQLAMGGDWSGAERAIYSGLRGLPPDRLPGAYIAAVDFVVKLLAGTPVASGPTPTLPVAGAAQAPAPASRPRLLTSSDPALNYAHAVLTALRGRLTATRPTAVRQAS